MGSRITEGQMIEVIERDYGFKRELIKNPRLCGLWHVRFEVNGILYYGSTPYHGAKPCLSVQGYIAKHYWHGTPITDEYYEEVIKGNKIEIIHYIDAGNDNGDWERTGIIFDTVEEAEAYISQLPNAKDYSHELVY